MLSNLQYMISDLAEKMAIETSEKVAYDLFLSPWEGKTNILTMPFPNSSTILGRSFYWGLITKREGNRIIISDEYRNTLVIIRPSQCTMNSTLFTGEEKTFFESQFTLIYKGLEVENKPALIMPWEEETTISGENINDMLYNYLDKIEADMKGVEIYDTMQPVR